MNPNDVVPVSGRFSYNDEGPQDVQQYASKTRVIASQFMAAFALSTLLFTCGTFVGFTDILLHQSKVSLGNDHNIDLITNYCYTPVLGYIFVIILAQYLGSKAIIMASALIFTICWLLFYWINMIPMLIATQSVIGLTMALVIAPSYTYLAEITQPLYRSTLMATLNFSLMLGEPFSNALNMEIVWQKIGLINFIFPLIGFAILCFLPESPYWLAIKNSEHGVEKSVAWFRGWTAVDNVKPVVSAIKKRAENSSNFPLNLMQRSFFLPLLLIVSLVFVDTFCGSETLYDYFSSILIFKMPIDHHLVKIVSQVGRILGGIISIFVIHYAGKRKLALVSLQVASVSLSIATIVGFVTNHSQSSPDYLHWLISLCAIISMSASTAGIHNVVLILSSEVFPMKLRQVGSGIAHLSIYLALWVSYFICKYTVDYIPGPGMLLIFAIMSFLGFILLFYVLPETEDKTLVKIEQYYAEFTLFRKKNVNRAQ